MNGRAAIQDLCAQCEGESAMSQIKAQAYETIKNASYSGQKQNWMINMYGTIHSKNHQNLEEYGRLVPQTQQVRDQIDGIDYSNKMMAAALATLLAANYLCEDIPAAFGYLCKFIADNKSETNTMSISGVTTAVWMVLEEATVV